MPGNRSVTIVEVEGDKYQRVCEVHIREHAGVLGVTCMHGEMEMRTTVCMCTRMLV